MGGRKRRRREEIKAREWGEGLYYPLELESVGP